VSLGSLGPVRVGYVAAAFVTMGAAVALTHHVLYLNLVAPSLARGEGVSIATWALVVAPVVLAAIALGVPIRGGAELIAAALAGELARGAYVAWASRAGLPPFGARPYGFEPADALLGALALALLVEVGALATDAVRRWRSRA
jgi:hypothetical protein